MRIKNIIGLTIIVGLTFIMLIQGCNHRKEVATLKSELSNCLNAPVHIDTVIKNDTIYIDRVIHPKPAVIIKPVDTSNCKDVLNAFLDTTYYADVLKTRDFDLNWGATVTQNQIAELRFPSYNLHTKEIHYTKVVDTCFNKPPAYKPMNHWILELDAAGYNLTTFPNIGGGITYTIKDRFGIGLGAEYNSYHNELYGKVGVKLFLR